MLLAGYCRLPRISHSSVLTILSWLEIQMDKSEQNWKLTFFFPVYSNNIHFSLCMPFISVWLQSNTKRLPLLEPGVGQRNTIWCLPSWLESVWLSLSPEQTRWEAPPVHRQDVLIGRWDKQQVCREVRTGKAQNAWKGRGGVDKTGGTLGKTKRQWSGLKMRKKMLDDWSGVNTADF